MMYNIVRSDLLKVKKVRKFSEIKTIPNIFVLATILYNIIDSPNQNCAYTALLNIRDSLSRIQVIFYTL